MIRWTDVRQFRRAMPITFAIVTVLVSAMPAYCRDAAAEMQEPVPIADHVTEASQRFGIPAGWIYAVMRAESAGRIGATSPVGAMGLMQIMPQTWAKLRDQYGLGHDAYDPHDNIIVGAAYGGRAGAGYVRCIMPDRSLAEYAQNYPPSPKDS